MVFTSKNMDVTTFLSDWIFVHFQDQLFSNHAVENRKCCIYVNRIKPSAYGSYHMQPAVQAFELNAHTNVCMLHFILAEVHIAQLQKHYTIIKLLLFRLRTGHYKAHKGQCSLTKVNVLNCVRNVSLVY